jgi:hypothetical protein
MTGAEARSPKVTNVEDEKPKNTNNKRGKGDMMPGKDPLYEDLDAVKSKVKERPEDFDSEGTKMKVRLNSAQGAGMSYEDWDPKIHGKAKQNEEKPCNNRLPEENRPRYEDSPLSFKRKPKGSQIENVGPLVHKNPIYDNSPVRPGFSRDGEKHVYDNVKLKQPEGGTSGNSIINPVYGQSMDFVEGTGDSASGVECPLYEVIPEKGKHPVHEKAKRKSYLRSVSSEKGYEELEKTDVENEEDKDEVFGDSKA